MKNITAIQKKSLSNNLVPLAAVIQQAAIPPSEQLNPSIPPYWDKQVPPGVDLHLDMADVITLFKLNKTLIHNKLDPDSDSYDEDWPEPIYPSRRKPVFLLSELIAWQDKLKAKRNTNTARGCSNE